MSRPRSLLAALIPAGAVLACALSSRAQNTPPVIDPLPPLITLEDRPLTGVIVRVTDAQSPASQISLTVMGRPRLADVSISGTGEERQLTLVPYANTNGVEVIQLLARDPAGAVSQLGVSLTVLPMDDPPEIDPLPDLVVAPGTQGKRVAVGIRDRDTILSKILLSASSSDEKVLATNRLSFRWEGTRAWLVVNVPANATGSTVVTLQAADETSAANASFQLEIKPPAFTQGQSMSRSANAVLDLNADGLMDVYSSFGTKPSVLLTRGVFQPQIEAPLPAGYAALTWGDFDGDGDVDALGAPVITRPDSVRFLRTDLVSSNLVQIVAVSNPPPSITVPLSPAVALSADIDLDGDLDAVLVGTAVALPPSLLRNEGGGSFAVEASGLPTGGQPLAFGDFDDDGDPDLLFRSEFAVFERSQLLFIYANDGSGRFSQQTTVANLTNGVVAAGALDLDGDGRLDLWAELTDSRSRTPELVVWRQQTGRFSEHLRLPLGALPNAVNFPVAWGDFDQDGSPDLLTAVRGALYGWPQLYLNDGAARLQALPLTSVTNNSPAWTSLPGLVPVDFNGDRRLDFLAATQRWTNTMSSLKVPILGTPTRLQAAVFGPVLWLSWDEPSGLPERLLPTYNVRVGTRPGAHDVVPAMARADGRRLLVAPGNAGHRRQLVLKLAQPPPRRLYWSVQAIDAAYQGGPFAGEQTLALPSPHNQPPQIGDLPDLTMNEDETREIEFAVLDDATPGDRLIVGAAASDPQLFPSGSLTPLPADPAAVSGVRRLRLTPRQDVSGSALVTVAAFDDDGLSGTRTFRVTVLPVADFPVPQVRTARQGATFVMAFDADSYTRWQLEVSTNLLDWQPVGEVTDMGFFPNNALLTAPIGVGSEFFRLRQVP